VRKTNVIGLIINAVLPAVLRFPQYLLTIIHTHKHKMPILLQIKAPMHKIHIDLRLALMEETIVDTSKTIEEVLNKWLLVNLLPDKELLLPAGIVEDARYAFVSYFWV
jgi:hypothetical protein